MKKNDCVEIVYNTSLFVRSILKTTWTISISKVEWKKHFKNSTHSLLPSPTDQNFEGCKFRTTPPPQLSKSVLRPALIFNITSSLYYYRCLVKKYSKWFSITVWKEALLLLKEIAATSFKYDHNLIVLANCKSYIYKCNRR